MSGTLKGIYVISKNHSHKQNFVQTISDPSPCEPDSLYNSAMQAPCFLRQWANNSTGALAVSNEGWWTVSTLPANHRSTQNWRQAAFSKWCQSIPKAMLLHYLPRARAKRLLSMSLFIGRSSMVGNSHEQKAQSMNVSLFKRTWYSSHCFWALSVREASLPPKL